MSVDLKIYGIRKLCDEEISEFTGKTVDKIFGSKYFRKRQIRILSYTGIG